MYVCTINADLANHIFLTFLQFTASFRIGNCSSSVLEFVNSEFIHFGFEFDFVESENGNSTRDTAEAQSAIGTICP